MVVVLSLEVVYAHCADSMGSRIPIPPIHAGREEPSLVQIYFLPTLLAWTSQIGCGSKVQKQHLINCHL